MFSISASVAPPDDGGGMEITGMAAILELHGVAPDGGVRGEVSQVMSPPPRRISAAISAAVRPR